MKVKFNENPAGIWIELKPETVEEMAQIARYALNAKAEKPFVSMGIGKEPYLFIGLNKVKKSVQVNSIRRAAK